MPNNNPKRQKGQEDSNASGISSAPRVEDDENTIITTTQRINRTFDEAKENTRRAVQEAERELPRYMQIITTNQEQSVGAVRDTIENYLRSEEHTSELQSRQYLVCRLLLEKKTTYARRTGRR